MNFEKKSDISKKDNVNSSIVSINITVTDFEFWKINDISKIVDVNSINFELKKMIFLIKMMWIVASWILVCL